MVHGLVPNMRIRGCQRTARITPHHSTHLRMRVRPPLRDWFNVNPPPTPAVYFATLLCTNPCNPPPPSHTVSITPTQPQPPLSTPLQPTHPPTLFHPLPPSTTHFHPFRPPPILFHPHPHAPGPARPCAAGVWPTAAAAPPASPWRSCAAAGRPCATCRRARARVCECVCVCVCVSGPKVNDTAAHTFLFRHLLPLFPPACPRS